MESLSIGTSQSASSTLRSSGSRTNSTRSGASVGQKKEEDYTKDNVVSPIDMEFRIQNERIAKILDEAISKIKLAVCLPDLEREGILKSLLSEQEYEDVNLTLEYSQFSSMSLLDNVSVKDEVIANSVSSTCKRLNPVQAHVIYILNSYPALKPLVQEMIDKTRVPQLPLEFLLVFKHFRDLTIEMCERTAAEELEIKLKTKKSSESNANLIKKINEYATILKEETASFEETMAMKTNEITSLEQMLLSIRRTETVTREKIILDTDRKMVLASRSHAIKKEILIEEEWQTRDTYNSCLKSHLIREKELRRRRFKVETQLIAWVQKYDQDMTEKQAELDDFIEKFDKESMLVEELEVQLEEQDKKYVPLMEEREKEYHQEMTEKMTMFLHEHAARVIQFAWRTVLFNRKEKSKLKKLLKKKKEAEEKAEELRLRKERAEMMRQKRAEKAAKKK